MVSRFSPRSQKKVRFQGRQLGDHVVVHKLPRGIVVNLARLSVLHTQKFPPARLQLQLISLITVVQNTSLNPSYRDDTSHNLVNSGFES